MPAIDAGPIGADAASSNEEGKHTRDIGFAGNQALTKLD
jgi:hypothetical protein